MFGSAQVFERVCSSVLPLYHVASQERISTLAERIHEMRSLLPCDLKMPQVSTITCVPFEYLGIS